MYRRRLSLTVGTLSASLLAASLAGCGGGTPSAQAASKPSAAASSPSLLLAAEDVLTLSSGVYSTGPVITGSLQPERRADLRAEIPAVVLEVLKENGDAVRKGDLLVRLDSTAIRDALASSEEAARAAGQSADQAQRQFQRMKTLQAQGMTSQMALDDAEVRRNNAQSELAAARARVVSARQQMQRTEVRAPFNGVVSERKASVGDTAQVGKELVKVIDPSSLRFDGLVAADRMGDLKPGLPVSFRVNGVPGRMFNGVIKRVDPAASATTRQVGVQVSISDPDVPRVAGLYAEGQVASTSQQALMLEEASVVREGDQAFAYRVQGGMLKKVPIVLGERDARSGGYVVSSGLAAGDRVLRAPTATLVDGQRVESAAARPAASASASAAPAANPAVPAPAPVSASSASLGK